MKTLTSICLVLAGLTLSGCWTTSHQGGVVSVDEQFSITVPNSTTVKQGADTTITISLNRGAYFKRDVQLDLATEGIRVTPASVSIKASDKPDAHFQIAVARDAALGEYRVSVKGTPTTGEPTSTAFTVKVVTD